MPEPCRKPRMGDAGHRCRSKVSEDNARMAGRLLPLTFANRTWVIGLCFLSLRNVKAMAYDHKGVCRIYRTLEIDRRIEPKRHFPLIHIVVQQVGFYGMADYG